MKRIIGIMIVMLLVGTTILPVVGSLSGKLGILELQDESLRDQIFDRILTLLMKIGHFPSLSACIIKNNEVVWSNGYGFYDIEGEKYSTENTIYMSCSISKTITGTALMQLYEQGLFDLDDDVNDYLPFILRNHNFPDEPITFRMLLSHASSINNDPDSFYWLNYSIDPPISWYPNPWLNEYLMPDGNYYVPEIWDDENPPGAEAEYANVNFVIISYLVELISGEPFLEYCTEHILTPLEMYNSSFNLSYFDIDNIAIPYHYRNGEFYTINNLVDIGWEWFNPPDIIYYRMLHYPIGGFYTSVSDLSHFLIAHMNGGVYNGVRILEEDTINEMHKIQPPNVGYGLAWYYTQSQYGKIFSGHQGDIPGYHTSMLVQYPNNDNGVIFFVNGDRYNLVGEYIQEIIRGILFLKANQF